MVEGVKHRCAAIIHQAKQRCAANAALSGGIVTLPDRQRFSRENLIPQGYLPGKVLPSVVFPQPAPEVPDWTRTMEEQRKACRAACARVVKDDRKIETADTTKPKQKKVCTASCARKSKGYLTSKGKDKLEEDGPSVFFREEVLDVEPRAKATSERREEYTTPDASTTTEQLERDVGTDTSEQEKFRSVDDMTTDLTNTLVIEEKRSKVSKAVETKGDDEGGDEAVEEHIIEETEKETGALELEDTLEEIPEQETLPKSVEFVYLKEISEDNLDQSKSEDETVMRQGDKNEYQAVEDDVTLTEEMSLLESTLIDESAAAELSELTSVPLSSATEDKIEESEAGKEAVVDLTTDDETKTIDTESGASVSVSEQTESISPAPLPPLVRSMQIETDLPLQGEQQLNMSSTDEDEIAAPKDTGLKIDSQPAEEPESLTIPRAITLRDSDGAIIETVSKEELIIVPITEIPSTKITNQHIVGAFVPRAPSLEEVEIERRHPDVQSKEISASPVLKDQICGTTREVCTTGCNTEAPRVPTAQPCVSRWDTPTQTTTVPPIVVPVAQTVPPPPPPVVSDKTTTAATAVEEKGTWVCRGKCTVITRTGDDKEETIIITDPEQKSDDFLESINLGRCRTPSPICRKICVDKESLVKADVTSTAAATEPQVEEKGTWVCKGKCTVITKGQNETVVIADTEMPTENIFENIHMGSQEETTGAICAIVCSDTGESGTVPCPYRAGTSRDTSLEESKTCRGVCATKKRAYFNFGGAPTDAKRVRRDEKRVCTAACARTDKQPTAKGLEGSLKR